MIAYELMNGKQIDIPTLLIKHKLSCNCFGVNLREGNMFSLIVTSRIFSYTHRNSLIQTGDRMTSEITVLE